MPRAWLCARGNDLPFALTTEQLDELGYGNISMKPFTKIAPLVVVQKPLTDGEIYKCYRVEFGLCPTDSEALKVITRFARAIEKAHGIGEKE